MSAPAILFKSIELPVSIDATGSQYVPFKLVCDAIGLNWRTQKRKVLKDSHYIKLFGVCLMPPKGHHKSAEQHAKRNYLIRLDRVFTFFNTLNPVQIKAQGNEAGANWILNQQYEWQGALNEYKSSLAAPNKASYAMQPFLDLSIQSSTQEHPK